MCALWRTDSKLNIALLIDRLDAVTQSREPFDKHGISNEGYLMALLGAVCFSKSIPAYLHRELLIKGYWAWREKEARTARTLINEVSKHEQAYLRATPTRYHLLTTLSVTHQEHFRRIKIDGCWIRFYRSCPARYDTSAYEENAIRHGVFEQEAESSTWLVVDVIDRSPTGAAYRALDAVSLLAGIWNLWAGYKRYRLHYDGPWEPIGRANVGPLHTLYYPDGKAAVDFILYEQEHCRRSRATSLPNSGRVHAYTRAILKRVGENRDPELMKDWLRRYAAALRLQSHESAFLKLWALLEQLTITGPSDGLGKAVNRAAFLWMSSEVHKEVLTALHKARNIQVHSESRDFGETARLWQTKKYVDDLMTFHLDRGRRFTSDELGRFMDAPHDPIKIDRLVTVLRAARRFRGPTLTSEDGGAA